MKQYRIRVCLLAALLALLIGAQATAEISFTGKVISEETATIMAPFGGIIDKIPLRAGDTLHIGDTVATIQTTKVYALMDGVVGGIFAKEGDDTEGITTRYGGVMYLEPLNQFVVTATTEKAYNSGSARFIHIGEEVYLSCTKDGSHKGVAVVTSVSDLDENGNTPYKLEVISGSFYMGETVGIYRRQNYQSSSRIGRGTIRQNAAMAVNGTGSVLKIHVQEGDRVERGELLFETVEGALDGLYAMDNTIVSGLEGIVASVDAGQGSKVEKGGKLVSIYPRDAMQIEMQVSELDLPEIHEGDKVSIEFEWDLDARHTLEGTITGISRVGVKPADTTAATTTQDAKYSVYVDFEPTDVVSMDMSVIVHLADVAEDFDEDMDEPVDAHFDEGNDDFEDDLEG